MITKARLQTFSRFYDELNDVVSTCVSAHNTMLNKALSKTVPLYANDASFFERDNTWHEGTIIDVTSDGIDIKWKEYWSRGGSDSGEFFISADVLDEKARADAIASIVEKKVLKFIDKCDQKTVLNRQHKLAELARLQKELGIND